jgi:hypothetical protein
MLGMAAVPAQHSGHSMLTAIQDEIIDRTQYNIRPASVSTEMAAADVTLDTTARNYRLSQKRLTVHVQN